MEKTERDIEASLDERVRALGGRTYKWTCPGQSGVPDRMVIMPDGRIIFVELKASSGKLSPLQKAQIDILKGLNCDVAVIAGMDRLDEFIKTLTWMYKE